MSIQRDYTSRRFAIVEALVEKLQGIDGYGDYVTDINSNVFPRLMFWDEIKDFPSVYVVPGDETRKYQGGGYRDRFLNVVIHCYVEDEGNSLRALEGLIEDIETVLETNARLSYTDRLGNTQCTRDIKIINISTDEGVLDPHGVGQISVEVSY